MKIQGKHFVITGGASGLGAAVAEYLIKQGAEISLIDMNIEAGHALVKLLGVKAQFFQLDVTSETQVEQFFISNARSGD